MDVIFFFTELPVLNRQHTAAVIEHTVEPAGQVSVASSTREFDYINILNLIVRKSTHLVVFGILAVLFFKSLKMKKYAFLFPWILTVLYAMTDEWHQSLIPGRVSSFHDVLIDSMGALIALVIVWLVGKKSYQYVVR